ncbi:M60 family metallopeptidase [Curtobacterium sp. VKM Ac-1393]|uniref:M60 family metallopeptidase n=1 Tax=Curtobacterium sp. VKM Ac-1393 TaxID=2783814 RepID=UPI00188D9365|nr:M60 family metallopeptidase [Curtobacterium sp. VKM Ac-1393]MBF4606162.1 hypothetical protein [Curtobacterium sp. VKM Ac-1393]
MHRSVLFPAALVAIALIVGGGTTAPATAEQTRAPSATSIEHADDGAETKVLVHGIGSASAAATAEGRRFPHSDLQPAGRFVESGETVTVTVPPGAPAMEVAIGLIGTYAAHNDGRDVGYRRTPLTPGVNEVTAVQDGMVSLVSTAPDGTATATISGGEPVPTWVRGQSTPESFAADFERWADAPFVEIVSERMFGDFQKPKTGTVIPGDDLVARTANWDRVVELTNETYGLHDDAVGTSHKHRHRIHIVSPDTGGGYANAGSGRIMFQVSTGAGGDLFRAPLNDQWALWHEIGHTYESSINSFPGTAETITNISSLAVQDGLGFGSRWDESTAMFERYFASEERDWTKANDRIRLLAWEQLRRAFGDAFLPRFFAAMRVESALTNPNVMTVDQKHALFVRVASQVADRDLAPFYDALGFPVSDTTRTELSALPALEQRIWDNVDSRERVVEHIIPGYDPPVGVLAAAVAAVPVGRHEVAVPTITGLGTTSGRGTAVAVDATAVADSVGPGQGRIAVRLRGDDGTEDALILTTDAVGGDSIVARGQANRVVGALWLDGAGALGWRPSTSYSSHTSWSGRAYLQIELRDPDGSVVETGIVRGNETGAVLDPVFAGRAYRDGQMLVVTHAQPAQLAAFGADVAIADGGAPQVFRIDGHHLVAVEPEAIPGWQVISGLEGEPVALRRGTDMAVPAELSVNAQITSITSTITMRSPEGTVFVPGQRTLAVSYRKPGEDWRSSTALALRNGTPSADGRTITFSMQTAAGFSLPPQSMLRWNPIVRVPVNAAVGTSALQMTAEGNAR